jgi:hypothetical protein
MRTTIQLLLTAALPAVLAAGTIPIGLSTSPVVFTPTGGSTGTIAIGASCMGEICTTGVSQPPLSVGWSLTTNGTLTYSGGPADYALSGNTSSFSLTDTATDSISGTVTWNTADVGASTTDLNGTLTLGNVHFGSDVDLLAIAAIKGFGSLPVSGEVGSIDLVVRCGTGPCITTEDPTGFILTSALTFNPASGGSPVPEPGTFFLPGLMLGLLALRKLYSI